LGIHFRPEVLLVELPDAGPHDNIENNCDEDGSPKFHQVYVFSYWYFKVFYLPHPHLNVKLPITVVGPVFLPESAANSRENIGTIKISVVKRIVDSYSWVACKTSKSGLLCILLENLVFRLIAFFFKVYE
jgi:hypothetical protein